MKPMTRVKITFEYDWNEFGADGIDETTGLHTSMSEMVKRHNLTDDCAVVTVTKTVLPETVVLKP